MGIVTGLLCWAVGYEIKPEAISAFNDCRCDGVRNTETNECFGC